MDPAEIEALVIAGITALSQLSSIWQRAKSGQELSEADRTVVKQEQAAAEARINADLS